MDARNSKCAKTVAYEMHMLRSLAALLEKREYGGDGVIPGRDDRRGTANFEPNEFEINWAVVEAFLVHARVLYTFFYAGFCKKHIDPARKGHPVPPHADDIAASDFFDSTQWEKLAGECPVDTCDLLSRMHKCFAHLSQERVKYEENPTESGWDIKGILTDLEVLIGKFLGSVSSEMRPWFEWKLKSREEE